MTDKKLPESADLIKAFETFVALTQKTDMLQTRLAAQQMDLDKLYNKLSQVDALEDSIEMLRNGFGGLKDSIQHVSVDLKGLLEKQDNKLNQIVSEVSGYDFKMKDLKEQMDQSEKGAYEGIQRVASQVARVEEQGVKFSSFYAHVQESDEKLQKLSSEFKSIKATLDSQNFVLTNLKDVLADHSEGILNARQGTDYFNSELSLKIKEVSQKIASVEEQLHSKIGIFFDKISKEIESCKLQVKLTPDSIGDLKKELTDSLETGALDASNAVLKAENAEHQFRILDRKLENINQLLKKLELTK